MPYLTITEKFVSSQHPALILVLQPVEADDHHYRLASFELYALLIVQCLILAPLFKLNVLVDLVHTPVAQISMHHFRPDAQSFHQDGVLVDLLMHGVNVKRVTWELLAPTIRLAFIVMERPSFTSNM